MSQTEVLITFHSRCGKTEKLALAAAVGAVQARANIRFRRLPDVGAIDESDLSSDCKKALQRMRKEYVAPSEADVLRADAIIFAAPALFRSVSAEWTEHLDLIQDLRSVGKLDGKVAAAIQSDAGLDSLASVILRLGFIMVPTGTQVDSAERALAHGRRLAEITKMLKNGHSIGK
jgi:multimeric flavodoxin WrbA